MNKPQLHKFNLLYKTKQYCLNETEANNINEIQFVTKVNLSFIVMSKGMIYKRVNVVEIRSPAFVVAASL